MLDVGFAWALACAGHREARWNEAKNCSGSDERQKKAIEAPAGSSRSGSLRIMSPLRNPLTRSGKKNV